jgi:RHS repeat-associated protein
VYLHQGGRYDSETGLYDFRNRFYDPDKGRWLNLDPIGFDAGDSNLYRYVENNPANLTDAMGLEGKNIYQEVRSIPGMKFAVIQADTYADLTEGDVKKWTKQWKEINVRVYQTDYFTANSVQKMLKEVSNFYKKYGIIINWSIIRIYTPKDGSQYTGTNYRTGASYSTYFPGEGDRQYKKYFDTLDLETLKNHLDVPDLAKEPELKWYVDHFDRQHVRVFLIDSIDKPGIHLGSAEDGLSYQNLIWIPDTTAGWHHSRSFALAHELGHVLGIMQHDEVFISVMSVQKTTKSLNELEIWSKGDFVKLGGKVVDQRDLIIELIRSSPLLKDIKDPPPSGSF